MQMGSDRRWQICNYNDYYYIYAIIIPIIVYCHTDVSAVIITIMFRIIIGINIGNHHHYVSYY